MMHGLIDEYLYLVHVPKVWDGGEGEGGGQLLPGDGEEGEGHALVGAQVLAQAGRPQAGAHLGQQVF